MAKILLRLIAVLISWLPLVAKADPSVSCFADSFLTVDCSIDLGTIPATSVKQVNWALTKPDGSTVKKTAKLSTNFPLMTIASLQISVTVLFKNATPPLLLNTSYQLSGIDPNSAAARIPKAPFTIGLSKNGSLTEGSQITLTTEVTKGAPKLPVSAIFQYGDGTTSTGTNLSSVHNYLDNGSYPALVQLTDAAGKIALAGLLIPIANVPPNTPSIDSSTLEARGSTVSFSGFADDPGANDSISYSWNFGEGSPAAGQFVSHTFNTLGTFLVTVTATDKDGASSTGTTSIDIVAPGSESPAALASKVLVVQNTAYPDSVEVASYYMSKRNIPAANRCSINVPGNVDWYIDLATYDNLVKTPVKNCLQTVGASKILYIVYTYKTPFRIFDGALPTSFARSVDSMTVDILDKLTPPEGYWHDNPYFKNIATAGNVYPSFVSFANYRKQASAKQIYSVWRLDAPTKELAKGLVDKAILAETNGLLGQGCFDRRYGAIAGVEDEELGTGDWDIHEAADFVSNAGFVVTEDSYDEEFGAAPAPLRCENATMYAGWYSVGRYNDAFSWTAGAVGFHLDSSSATNPRNASFVGEDANWAGGALSRGITITAGSVNEPYLETLPHADGVFKNLLEGANAGDTFLRNTDGVKWMMLFIGDPLYRPFSSN